MIGNDVVDLRLAQKDSNWKRKGFLNKIFTEREQLLILKSENSEIMVWNLWSRKEAAYKIYNRKNQIRGYFPLQLECFDIEIRNGLYFGKVIIKEVVFFTKTEITTRYIYTIAAENIEDFDKIKTLESRKNIIKNKGIPFYIGTKNLFQKSVSISNHGEFEKIIYL